MPGLLHCGLVPAFSLLTLPFNQTYLAALAAAFGGSPANYSFGPGPSVVASASIPGYLPFLLDLVTAAFGGSLLGALCSHASQVPGCEFSCPVCFK